MAGSYAYKQFPEVIYFIHAATACMIEFKVSSEQMKYRLKILKLCTSSPNI